MRGVKIMFSKHMEFADSLRSIMRDTEIKRHSVTEKGGAESSGEEISSIADELEIKFDELFGPLDNDD